MPAPSIRPAADPLDDIDREQGGVDDLMARQERADDPAARSDEPDAGNGDKYLDATRDIAEEEVDPGQAARDDDRESARVADGDPDIAMAVDEIAPAEIGRGADDDDPIDETERAGDDAVR